VYDKIDLYCKRREKVLKTVRQRNLETEPVEGVDSSNQIETEGNTTISIEIDNHHMTNKKVKEITELEDKNEQFRTNKEGKRISDMEEIIEAEIAENQQTEPIETREQNIKNKKKDVQEMVRMDAYKIASIITHILGFARIKNNLQYDTLKRQIAEIIDNAKETLPESFDDILQKLRKALPYSLPVSNRRNLEEIATALYCVYKFGLLPKEYIEDDRKYLPALLLNLE
ncbi:5027_t:CDS:2, partial [Gigaspora margarita]